MSFDTITLNEEQEISIGAEARIYKSLYIHYQVLCKERRVKSYRVSDIDEKLRKERTTQEVRLLQQAYNAGIPVPLVYDVDKSTWTIIMEYIAGNGIKDAMSDPQISDLFGKIGHYVARLHGINIIHGDLTTSNILLGSDKSLWFIDFGLGFISVHIEDKAVDILVLKNTLESSHPDQYKECFSAFREGYHKESKEAEKIFDRLSKIEARVRYKDHN